GDLSEIMLLLLLGPEFEQGRPENRHSEAGERRTTADPLHFLLQHPRFGGGKTAAAIFLGPIGHGPAARRHSFEPVALGVGLKGPGAAAPADVGLRSDGLSHLWRAIGFEPGAVV